MFQNNMNQYQESAGRGLEVIVGMVVMVIAIIFVILLFILATNASISLASLIGGLVLALIAYWFGQISVRLLFNLPRKNGGLFSIGGLKFWCVFLGLSSILTTILGVYIGQYFLSLASIVFVIACFSGWQLASKRK